MVDVTDGVYSVMNENPNPLPSFEKPPVVEVVLGTQFEVIKGLRTPQLGLLWQEFKDRFPSTEEHPPIESAIERFGGIRSPAQTPSFQILDVLPIPRCWFSSPEGSELIQVQQDRFIRNWRKRADDDTYPRYQSLRTSFEADYGRFAEFIRRENLGELIANQCEVTYVNHVLPGTVWHDHSQLDRVLSVIGLYYSDAFLNEPEESRVTLKYIIRALNGEPIGRLHIAAEPVYRVNDDVPMFRLQLVARGRPQGEGLEGVLRFFDIGREWVVRGFAAITTKEMHHEWRRIQ